MMVNSQVYAQMQRSLHGPDWRWQQALSRVDTSLAPSKMDDPYLCDALKFLRQRAGGVAAKAGAARKIQHVAAAERLARNDHECGQLKVLVLSGCSQEEITQRLSMDLQVLATWEKLFFDVREAREASDWISRSVISPVKQSGDTRLATKLRFVCAGGPIAALAILDAESRLSLQQGVTLFDRKIALGLKFAEAIEVPLKSDRAKLSFMKIYLKLRYQEQRLRLAEQRLKQKCDEALCRQRRAEQRLERRRQRDQERAAKAAEKEAKQALKRGEHQRKKYQTKVEGKRFAAKAKCA